MGFKRATPGTIVQIDASTYNAILDLLDEWRTLRVQDFTDDANSSQRSSLSRARGGSILRIVHPPSSGSSLPAGYSEMEITFCDDEDEEVTKIFLVKDPE